jgi:hypothetical protein
MQCAALSEDCICIRIRCCASVHRSFSERGDAYETGSLRLVVQRRSRADLAVSQAAFGRQPARPHERRDQHAQDERGTLRRREALEIAPRGRALAAWG